MATNVPKPKNGAKTARNCIDDGSALSLEARKALKLVGKDKLPPTDLHLKSGELKKLADGVSIRKRRDGVLELGVSEG